MLSPEKILLYHTLTDLALACFVKTAEAGNSVISEVHPIQGINPIEVPSWYKNLTRKRLCQQKQQQVLQKQQLEEASKPKRNACAEFYAQNHGINPQWIYTDPGKAYDALIQFAVKPHEENS